MTTSNEHNNAPAVPQEEGRPGIPLRKAYKHLLIVAPAQEIDKSVADAEIKSMYVESQGSDKGWLGIEGSYFIGGVVAARKQKAAPAQERCSTCGYLTSEREHLGCLRRAVKDLDIATGGPYDAQEVGTTTDAIHAGLWRHAVRKGVVTVHTECMDDRNPGTKCSWIQGHDKAADVSNEAAAFRAKGVK